MAPRRIASALLAAALVALLLGGCGGPSKDEYLLGLERVQQHLEASSTASLESGQAEDVQVKRAKLGEAHAALVDAADEAEALDPPADAADAHEAFAEALRDYAEIYDRLARLEANDPEEAQLVAEANDIANRLSDASRRLEQAGYEVADKEQDE